MQEQAALIEAARTAGGIGLLLIGLLFVAVPVIMGIFNIWTIRLARRNQGGR